MYSCTVPGQLKATEQMQVAASTQHQTADQTAANKVHETAEQVQFQHLGPDSKCIQT